MHYSKHEIMHTLYLYMIAKGKYTELKHITDNSNTNSYDKVLNQNLLLYYEEMILLVESWIKELFIDEKQIIKLRFFDLKSYEDISIELNYKNHSGPIKKINKIIKKIEKIANHSL